jgi:diadenosine tetraphosphatase ApaH/serine/threonine PP2A family protein phosphatase
LRIGILSDVHANLEALEAVFESLRAARCDQLVCLGDVVGYGAQPNECCELIRRNVNATILGNHDAAVAGRMDYSYYRAPARQALDWHARVLSRENMAWLRSLPYTHEIEDVAFCHGSPAAIEDFEYVFVVDQVRELSVRLNDFKPVTFIGHSHLCKSFAFDAKTAEEILHTRFTCDPSRRYIVTAGSVGQPRDYDSRACCAVYDTTSRRFEYRRVPYDVESAARKIFSSELAVAFGKRLFLGV